MEEIELVAGKPRRTVKIGIDIDPILRVNMIRLLQEHVDVFAFSATKYLGSTQIS